MKKLLFLFIFSSAAAIASSVDSRTLSIGADSIENFSLNTMQTRIAYRQETVARTCFRTEFYGYRNECQYYPEVRCSSPSRESAPICTSVPVYRCQQVPEYREVPYTCYQTISTPYEVPDHQVISNFTIKVASNPKEPTNPTGCLVGFTMEGETLKSSANCNEYLVLSNEQKSSSVQPDGAVINNFNITLKLLNKDSTLAPVSKGITDMQINGNFLVFKTGDLSKNPNFNLKLYIERRRILKSDETIINRNITPNEYTFEKQSDDYGIVKINLDKLVGGVNEKKKHVFKVGLSVNLEPGTIINNSTPVLKVEESITVNH